MAFIQLTLQAQNETRSIDRVYVLRFSKGLLNQFCIQIAYGKSSKGSTIRNYSFVTLDEARFFWIKKLKRRSTAKSRFGLSYTIKGLTFSKAIQEKTVQEQWLQPFFCHSFS
jgi:hypothetical protein